jgi:hypothetical protein
MAEERGNLMVHQRINSKRDTQKHNGNKSKKKKESIQEKISRQLSLKKGEMKAFLYLYQDKIEKSSGKILSCITSWDAKNNRFYLKTINGSELVYVEFVYSKKHKKCFYKIKPKGKEVIIANDTEFSSLKSQIGLGGEEIQNNLKPIFESYNMSY